MTAGAGAGAVAAAASRDQDWHRTEPPDELRHAPRIAVEPIDDCPVCGGREHSNWAVGFDYESATCSNPWRFVRCRDCDHVWLNPRPALAELGVIYPPTYYAYRYDEVNAVARRGKEFLDRLRTRSILRHLNRPPGSFLDIGCGDGRYLRLFERRGIPRQRLYGIELDAEVVARLAGEGYQVSLGRVEDCDAIPDGAVDLATMFHVIEHVDDPAAVIGRVARWLAPGGLFALETPNLDSLDARWFRDRYWGGYHIPRHWNLFTAATLGRLLADSGLEVRAVRYQTGHSFWMFSFHHLLRYRPGRPRPRLARRFDPLSSLLPLMLFTGFDKLRAALGARTSSMLVLAAKPAV